MLDTRTQAEDRTGLVIPGSNLGWLGTRGARALLVEGAAQRAPAVFGDGRALEPAATNRCTNPSFEVNTTGWATLSAGLVRTASAAAIGGWGARLTAAAGASRHQAYSTANGIVTGGQTVTVSTFARRGGNSDWCAFGDAGDNTWHRAFFNLATGAVGATHGTITGARAEDASAERGAGWWRLIVTYAHDVGGTGNVQATFEVVGANSQPSGFTAAGNEYHDFDGVSIEVGTAEVGGHFDGDSGTGYAWSGTAHGSSSTRASGGWTLPADTVSTIAGGFACWLRPAWSGAASGEHVLLHVDDGGGSALIIRHQDGAWRLEVTSPGGYAAHVTVSATHAARDAVRLIAGWDRAHLALSVGAADARVARGAACGEAEAPALIGRLAGGGSSLNAVVDSFACLAEPIGASAVQAWARLSRRLRWDDVALGGDGG